MTGSKELTIIRNVFSQHEGNRHYLLKNGVVQLQKSTIETLKNWYQNYPDVLLDSKFLKRLALDVFGGDCLSKSSVLGKKSKRSVLGDKTNMSAEVHPALDAVKLDFMRGTLLTDQ